MKKVLLVTGARSGLGKVIYERLKVIDDYVVYGSSRQPGESDLLKMDITSATGVEACIQGIIEEEGRLDVVINNAGINLIGSLEGTSEREFLEQLDVNCLGAVRVIKAVMPYFREDDTGRIINISSVGAKVPLPFNSGYAASKAALENMTESFAYELEDTSITVSMVEPIALTIDSVKPKLKYVSNENPHQIRSRQLYDLMMTTVTPSVTKEAVAEKVLKIIETTKPRLRYRVGLGSTTIMVLKSLLPSSLFRKMMSRLLNP